MMGTKTVTNWSRPIKTGRNISSLFPPVIEHFWSYVKKTWPQSVRRALRVKGGDPETDLQSTMAPLLTLTQLFSWFVPTVSTSILLNRSEMSTETVRPMKTFRYSHKNKKLFSQLRCDVSTFLAGLRQCHVLLDEPFQHKVPGGMLCHVQLQHKPTV